MHVQTLHERLIASLRKRLQDGELSERRLATITGISQPHIHNVLKGARILSPRAADRVLRRLDLSLLDLMDPREEGGNRRCQSGGGTGCIEVPVLMGCLGPGLPLPKEPSRVEHYPFPRSLLSVVERPLVARLASDRQMSGGLQGSDLVLLDHSPSRRLNPQENELYAVNRFGEGVVRGLRLERNDLLLLRGIAFGGIETLAALPLKNFHLLDVVIARVAWMGRWLPAH